MWLKDVEGFQPELARLRFTDSEISLQRQIGVEHPGPGKVSPRRVTGGAYGIVGEGAGIEILQLAVAVRIRDVQRLSREIRQVQGAVVNAIRAAPLQGIVAVRAQSNWETTAGAGDAGYLPALQKRASVVRQKFERQSVIVGRHKVMRQIKGRNPARESEIEGIDSIGKRRGLVDRLAVRIAERICKSLGRGSTLTCSAL